MHLEYTSEALWKAAQMYREFEGIDAASLRGTIRACFRVDVLSHEEAEHALKVVDDRNLSVHTYNETLAERIFSRLPAHAALPARWLEAMTRNLSE